MRNQSKLLHMLLSANPQKHPAEHQGGLPFLPSELATNMIKHPHPLHQTSHRVALAQWLVHCAVTIFGWVGCLMRQQNKTKPRRISKWPASNKNPAI